MQSKKFSAEQKKYRNAALLPQKKPCKKLLKIERDKKSAAKAALGKKELKTAARKRMLELCLAHILFAEEGFVHGICLRERKRSVAARNGF